MKLSSILILGALVVAIFSPFTAHISISPADHAKYFVSLDVCNASGLFMSANADTPSLHECTCKPVPFEVAFFIEAENSSFAPFLSSSQIEQPPRV